MVVDDLAHLDEKWMVWQFIDFAADLNVMAGEPER
jgi:hypothetical protein